MEQQPAQVVDGPRASMKEPASSLCFVSPVTCLLNHLRLQSEPGLFPNLRPTLIFFIRSGHLAFYCSIIISACMNLGETIVGRKSACSIRSKRSWTDEAERKIKIDFRPVLCRASDRNHEFYYYSRDAGWANKIR